MVYQAELKTIDPEPSLQEKELNISAMHEADETKTLSDPKRTDNALTKLLLNLIPTHC